MLWRNLAIIPEEVMSRLIDYYLEFSYDKHRYKYHLWREYKLEKVGKDFDRDYCIVCDTLFL